MNLTTCVSRVAEHPFDFFAVRDEKLFRGNDFVRVRANPVLENVSAFRDRFRSVKLDGCIIGTEALGRVIDLATDARVIINDNNRVVFIDYLGFGDVRDFRFRNVSLVCDDRFLNIRRGKFHFRGHRCGVFDHRCRGHFLRRCRFCYLCGRCCQLALICHGDFMRARIFAEGIQGVARCLRGYVRIANRCEDHDRGQYCGQMTFDCLHNFCLLASPTLLLQLRCGCR